MTSTTIKKCRYCNEEYVSRKLARNHFNDKHFDRIFEEEIINNTKKHYCSKCYTELTYSEYKKGNLCIQHI